ncbi:carbohydrate kinase family protein [Paenibacillus mucilaginosus]|nr:carbohydrate kinase family protein [Paenibacillus mucilaginosus]
MDHQGHYQGVRGSSAGNEAGSRHGVCMVGNVNIDLLMKSLPELPAWGTEALVESYEERLGGCAGNSALVLAALGEETHIVAAVGEDRLGRKLTAELQQAGVRLDGLKRSSQATGVSLSLNRPDGERLFVTYPGSMLDTSCEEVMNYLRRAPYCKALLLTGYFLLSPDIHAKEIFRAASELGMVTLFDTGWPTQDWSPEIREEIWGLLPLVDYFLPNELEAAALTGKSHYSEAAGMLAAQCRRGVVIKRGREGSCFLGRDGKEINTTGYEVRVKDTVGAGDSFNAGFIYGLLQDWPAARCIELGNAVAASVISGDAGFHVLWNQVHQLLEDSTRFKG